PRSDGSYGASETFASRRAWIAAASPKLPARPRFSPMDGSPLSRYLDRSKSLTRPAICTLYVSGSNVVMRPTPLLPATNDCHVESTSLPTGVTAPIPVTATRVMIRPHASTFSASAPYRRDQRDPARR